MTSSTDLSTTSGFQRHIAVQLSMATAMFALSVANVIAHPVTSHVIDRHTEQQQTRKRESVHTAKRCTSLCPPTACTCVHTLKDASVNTAVRNSVDRGCFRATFELTRVRNRSLVPRVRNHLQTNRICARMFRRTRAKNLSFAVGAGRPLRWRAIFISTRSHLACEDRDSNNRT